MAEIEAEEEETEDERSDILRDGQRVRVSLLMRDGAINPDLLPHQRAKALHQTEDAVARRFGLSDAQQLHRPGFRRNTDVAALARVQQAYADAEAADANAWKGGPLRQGHGKVEPAPDQRQDLDAKQAAYEAYDREMAQAYLRGK
jgi:hypothetical protein